MITTQTIADSVDVPGHKEFLPFSQPDIGQAEIEEVVDALRSDCITTGPKPRQFETEFAAAVAANHAVAVNSCTAAVHLAWVVRRVGRNLFWLGLSLLGLGLLAWYPMRWWPGDRFYPVRLLNYLTPWLLVGLVPTLVITGLMRRQGAWWLIIAIPAMLISLPLLPLFLPRLGAEPATSLPFEVMSYSVCSANRNSPAIVQIIWKMQPDLLLLQEIEPDVAEALNDELLDLYPAGEFQFAYAPEARQMIISRYPLTPLGVAPEQGLVQKVRVEAPGGSITVWNVHTSQPRFWAQHYRELSALAKEISTVGGPLIVGGDFNTMDLSETYQLVARYLHNAHREAGWGFGFTFPAPSPDFECRPVVNIPIIWPLVRIDHIFYSDHFFAHRAGTLATSGGSDHLPVVAELSLRN